MLTIIRNGIRRGPQAVKVISSLVIRLKLSAQVKLNLLRILLLIQTIRRRLPDLYICADEGLLRLKVDDLAVHKGHFTTVLGLSDDDVGAVLAVGRVGAEEGAQNSGRGGCVLGFFSESEGDFVDQAVDCELAFCMAL
jgi:hypothetical protein